MFKTPGNIAPGKQIETPSGSNYQGRNFDPSSAPWTRDNQMKGKGKEKGKGKKGKDTPRSAPPWQ